MKSELKHGTVTLQRTIKNICFGKPKQNIFKIGRQISLDLVFRVIRVGVMRVRVWLSITWNGGDDIRGVNRSSRKFCFKCSTKHP